MTWWETVSGESLGQGEILRDCRMTVVEGGERSGTPVVRVQIADCIIMTQSCDIQQEKVDSLILCPISTIADYEGVTLEMLFEDTSQLKGRRSLLERVRRGEVMNLHMVAPTDDTTDPWKSLIVDFRQIHSISLSQAREHAVSLGFRHRLVPPYVEHLSQSFARFFMRVGLPSTIPAFK